MDNTKNKNEASKRFKEILEVLRHHNIIHGVSPQKLRLILEDLGPTFVKLGQIMSMRSDMLPQAYCDELIKLRADVKPVEFEEIIKVIESEYKTNYDEYFLEIDNKPLGSASIAQVHCALLKDNTKVVIKVQRPNIDKIMAQDIVLMRKAIKLLKIIPAVDGLIDFNAVIEELWTVSKQEMDFLLEADNIKQFSELNKNIDFIEFPKVKYNLCTYKILVMEFIDGCQIDDIEQIKKLGYDLNDLGTKLAKNYAKQVLEDGFFHADPHPGNIWVRNNKIVWLDLGMVGKLSSYDRQLFKNVVNAMVNSDIYALEDAVLTIGTANSRINHARLYTDIDDLFTKYGLMDFANINLGVLIQELIELAKFHDITMPASITMLGRGLVTLEGVMSVCCPDINFLQIMSEYINFFKDFDIKKEIHHFIKSFHNLFRKSIDVPAQISDILKMVKKGQAKINLELAGAEEPMRQLDHMVDKLVICIISAALLIGSSLLCTTKMKPEILGIPALGAIGFLSAAILGLWLLIDIKHKK